MQFSRAELSVLVLHIHQHILKMGTELIFQRSENLHILTKLSAPTKFYWILSLRKLQDLYNQHVNKSTSKSKKAGTWFRPPNLLSRYQLQAEISGKYIVTIC
jgi:hypothetical protein